MSSAPRVSTNAASWQWHTRPPCRSQQACYNATCLRASYKSSTSGLHIPSPFGSCPLRLSRGSYVQVAGGLSMGSAVGTWELVIGKAC
eukprot:357397-Chlamydomonas_euryale.AAC.7